jgi:hypothetical protein
VIDEEELRRGLEGIELAIAAVMQAQGLPPSLSAAE